MNFNKDQLNAINSPLSKDVLVAAGAGSGKTNTLKEKVFTIIESGQVKPSELLILTFTDNAAHEMRERILERMKNGASEDVVNQISSAHIQTFDSFARYLVVSNADYLGISSNVNLANSDVIAAKKNELLTEIFKEYYDDEDKRNRLIRTLKKFNLFGDKATRKVVLDLFNNLEKLTLERKEQIINHYDELYLSDESIRKVIDEFINENKKIVIETIKEAYFIEQHYDVLENDNPSLLKQVFDNPSSFNIDYKTCNFYNQSFNQVIYQELKSLLLLDGQQFVTKINDIAFDETLFPKKVSKKEFENEKDIAVNSVFRSLFKGENKKLANVLLIDKHLENEIAKIRYFKDDIAILLEMVNELSNRLLDYKYTTNSFEFNDILRMAVSLLTNDKYIDIAIKVREQFKFIMVDEYQDTNDFQELIINSLTKKKKDGTRAHLFAVGDAKQAIYGFRNSKVELFKDRERLYDDDGDEHEVILMSKNYRSTKTLLSDINYIFSFYMTLNHGGIDYAYGSESLQYDDEHGPYNKYPYSQSGVSRITSVSGFKNDSYFDGPLMWEIHAIAKDIQDKIENHFKVYRRTKDGGALEDCTYKDFVIIMRTSRDFRQFQEVFKSSGVPLNNKLKTDLQEINAILLIQSLVELIVHELCGIECEKALLFASLARSYIYEYDDQRLYDILKYHDESKMDEDRIMVDVKSFAERNKDKTAFELFVNMLNDFKVVEKLHLLGDIEDNVSKIESLSKILRLQEAMGDNLYDFVNLLRTINRYSLSLASDTTVKMGNAVDMMTIHASKGLENKIVYLPISCNQLSQGSNIDKADYIFSEKYGIILPYYNYDASNVDEDGNIKDVLIDTLPSFLVSDKENNPERDEHVRLFYVALTRAENIVYIVGDKDQSVDNKKKETLYGMLSYLPHYQKIDEQYALDKINRGEIDKKLYGQYLNTIELIKSVELLRANKIDADTYKLYNKLFYEKYVGKLNSLLKQQILSIFKDSFRSFYLRFVSMNRDPIIDAAIYALFKYNCEIVSIEELDGMVKNDPSVKFDLDDEIEMFVNAVINKTYTYFATVTAAKEMAKKEENDIPYGLFDVLMPVFVRFFDNQKRFLFESYQNNNYQDEIITIDHNSFIEEDDYDSAEDLIEKTQAINFSNKVVDFPPIIKQRASKEKEYDENIEEEVPNFVLDRGTYLHRLMELVNFVSKDTSFIKNEKDRKIIDNVLNNKIFEGLENAKIYKEYGYYDEVLQTTGFIDLLYFKDDECYIVDYKSRSIDDEAYIRQLHIYQRNIESLFNIKKEKMHLYLLSLIENRIKEVDCE